MDLSADDRASSPIPPPCTVPAGLLPSFVAQHWHRLGEVETCREIIPAGVRLPDVILGAAPKRRREFLAGRHCALIAANSCRPAPPVEEIPIGANRAPQWPSGIVGSITHTSDFAWAAAALTEHARGVGIDCEPLASDRLARELSPMIATEAELETLRAASLPLAVAFTLTFSAKEALFKCLYPEVGRYFDYRDAELSAAAEPGVVRLTLCCELGSTWRRGRVISGRFFVKEDHVFTAFVRDRSDEDLCPPSLGEPVRQSEVE